MNGWSLKWIAVVTGLSALAVNAALMVDQGVSAAGPVLPGGGFPAAGVTTSSTALFASPTIHATEGGKCVKSSPQC